MFVSKTGWYVFRACVQVPAGLMREKNVGTLASTTGQKNVEHTHKAKKRLFQQAINYTYVRDEHPPRGRDAWRGVRRSATSSTA